MVKGCEYSILEEFLNKMPESQSFRGNTVNSKHFIGKKNVNKSNAMGTIFTNLRFVFKH